MPTLQIAGFNPRQRVINFIVKVALRNGDIVDREQLIDVVLATFNANNRNVIGRPAVNTIIDKLIQQGIINQG